MYAWANLIGTDNFICIPRIYLFGGKQYTDAARARMALRAYAQSLGFAGTPVATEVFWTQWFVDFRPPGVWVNCPSLPALQVGGTTG